MKIPTNTDTETTHIVLPPNANPYGNAFGGWLMAQMDLAIFYYNFCVCF